MPQSKHAGSTSPLTELVHTAAEAGHVGRALLEHVVVLVAARVSDLDCAESADGVVPDDAVGLALVVVDVLAGFLALRADTDLRESACLVAEGFCAAITDRVSAWADRLVAAGNASTGEELASSWRAVSDEIRHHVRACRAGNG
ncbi:hypothetical protein [Umezawaea tangerina]|uniref:Uncharacterized protein n=1 Tax=Umezawaea tangerina TaxID=84725 RepID=A0A2T0T053_9PSEU|nr:hypothetical protein [Umezawaea tangerina]PRY39058.1 hypothetical protein CLV43_108458 [Umezawaea tangerina]